MAGMEDIVKPGFTQTSQEEYEQKYETRPNPDGFWDLWGLFDSPCKDWKESTKFHSTGVFICPKGCSNWDKPCPKGKYHASPCGYCKDDPRYFCKETTFGRHVKRAPGTLGPGDPGCWPERVQYYYPPGSRQHGDFQPNYTPAVIGLALVSAGLIAAGLRERSR